MLRAWFCSCACVCALLACAAPAPPLHTHVKEPKIKEKTIVVRRMPNAYFYPFSLWPLPKFPDREGEESNEKFRYRRETDILRESLVLQPKLNKR